VVPLMNAAHSRRSRFPPQTTASGVRMIGMPHPPPPRSTHRRPRRCGRGRISSRWRGDHRLLAVTNGLPAAIAIRSGWRAGLEAADHLHAIVDGGIVDHQGRVGVNSSASQGDRPGAPKNPRTATRCSRSSATQRMGDQLGWRRISAKRRHPRLAKDQANPNARWS